MPLTIQPATPADVSTLVAILFTAFADDTLIMKCYPDHPANRSWWVRSIQSQMQSPATKVLKAVDSETGETVAFAKWLIHQKQGEKVGEQGPGVTGAVQPTEPTMVMDVESCKRLAGGQYKMREEIMGGRDHLWLNALVTHPEHQRRGAATMLVQWGEEQADHLGPEGVECFSACTRNAKGRVGGILERRGWVLRGEEEVVEAEGLSVFGGWRKARV